MAKCKSGLGVGALCLATHAREAGARAPPTYGDLSPLPEDNGALGRWQSPACWWGWGGEGSVSTTVGYVSAWPACFWLEGGRLTCESQGWRLRRAWDGHCVLSPSWGASIRPPPGPRGLGPEQPTCVASEARVLSQGQVLSLAAPHSLGQPGGCGRSRGQGSRMETGRAPAQAVQTPTASPPKPRRGGMAIGGQVCLAPALRESGDLPS